MHKGNPSCTFGSFVVQILILDRQGKRRVPRLRRIAAQPVNLCRHNEVTFGQPIDFVRPQSDFGLAP